MPFFKYGGYDRYTSVSPYVEIKMSATRFTRRRQTRADCGPIADDGLPAYIQVSIVVLKVL